MNSERFDRFTRTLRSRRSALGGLMGGVALLGVLLPAANAHTIPVARCRRIKNVPRRRACLKKARAHNATHRRPPRQPNAACSAIIDIPTVRGLVGNQRIAQTFTEPNGGRLNAVQVIISKLPATTGDYKLEVNTVDAGTGVPTNNSIAAAVVPTSHVGTSSTLVTFRFEVPPLLVAGRQYALVHSRPGGSANHAVPVQAPGPCPGGGAFESDSLTGPFTPLSETDAFYATFVSL